MKNYFKGILILATTIASAQVETHKDSIPAELQEVVIDGNPKIFSHKNGNIKVDVAHSYLNSVPNTIDILAKLPTLLISPDRESVGVAGKGNALVYIDGQKVSVNDLNSLAPDEVKTIEIIRNPSSKYEAEGRAVILITRKFSKKEGFKLGVSETASFKKHFNNYFGVSAALRKSKFEFKLSLDYNRLHPWESNGNDFRIPARNIASDFRVEDHYKRPQFIVAAGIFYKINETDYLSLNISNRYQEDLNDIQTRTFYTQDGNSHHIITKNDTDENRDFANVFLNYNKKMAAADALLFLGAQYSRFSQRLDSDISNNFDDTAFLQGQLAWQRFSIGVFSFRADFEKKFKNGIGIQTGVLYLSALADTYRKQSDTGSNSVETVNYHQVESNPAAYIQLSGKSGKWSWSAGLRAENTNIKRENDSGDIDGIQKEYTSFFPKAQLEIPLDSTKTFTVSYAKSIARPDYSSTGQVSLYANPYFSYSGNAGLEPQIGQEVSAGFQYGGKSVQLAFFENRNPVYFTFLYDALGNLTFQPLNFKKESGCTLYVSLPFTAGFWSSENSLMGIYNKIEDPSAGASKSSPYLYYYSGQTFSFRKNLTFTAAGWGFTKRNEGAMNRNPYFILNLSIGKNFGNWSCSLAYNDVFKEMKFNENYQVGGIDSKARYFTDTNEISMGVKYSFGKIRDSGMKEKTVNESLERIK